MPIAHYAPAVYSRFCCTASACSDNCCIGWEIDIDPDTARFYDTLPGPDGDWLRAGISPPGELPRRFCAGEDGRCPFLNENNLCGAYLRLGERAMAEICREHPRFHNWCGPFVESGLGLCCEEVCRLILTGREPFRLTRLEDLPDDPEGTMEPLEPLLALRRRAFRLLEERPLLEALEALARLGYAAQHCPGAPDRAPLPETALPPLTGRDGAALVEGFARLERLTDEWEGLLAQAAEHPELFGAFTLPGDPEAEGDYRQLAGYLLYRHLLPFGLDGDLCGPLVLPLAVCRLTAGLERLCGGGREQRLHLAKLFSKEVEYCEESLPALLPELTYRQALRERRVG